MTGPIERAKAAGELHALAHAVAAGSVPLPLMRHDQADGYRIRIVPRVLHNALCSWRVGTKQDTTPPVVACNGCGLAYPPASVDPTGLATDRIPTEHRALVAYLQSQPPHAREGLIDRLEAQLAATGVPDPFEAAAEMVGRALDDPEYRP
ncbi:hypothetical protein AB0F93_03515 [Micromonospora tulbaghiae]|uniref:hypothetical protein n=1 Tax=Micromonospora tulbaghiae TaxID=479978 RepID=UPI00332E98C5